MNDKAKLLKLFLLAVFVAVNVFIAGPLAAGYKDDLCVDEDLNVVPCCTVCIIFCGC